jgi:hypothetical protein
MEQPSTSAIGFREVDRDGNPVTGDHPLDAAGDAGRSNAPAFNPFIAVLWLLTTLLIGGGAWIFLNADSMVGPSAGGGMPTSFLIFTFAPYALFAGSACCSGMHCSGSADGASRRSNQGGRWLDATRFPGWPHGKHPAGDPCAADGSVPWATSWFAQRLVSMLRYWGK